MIEPHPLPSPLFLLPQYLDFFAVNAPHKRSKKQRDAGALVQAAGGLQFAKNVYKREIGKLSTSLVSVSVAISHFAQHFRGTFCWCC